MGALWERGLKQCWLEHVVWQCDIFHFCHRSFPPLFDKPPCPRVAASRLRGHRALRQVNWATRAEARIQASNINSIIATSSTIAPHAEAEGPAARSEGRARGGQGEKGRAGAAMATHEG